MDQLAPRDLPSDPIARARALGPAIREAADGIERTQRLPASLLDALHAARLFRMLIPRSVGGDQSDPGTYLRVIEEIGRYDGSVCWCVSIANSIGLFAAYLPLDSAQAIYGDPRAVIAWGPPNEAQARAVPGGYRVTGTWEFASGSRHATWMGAHGNVVEPDGALRLHPNGRPVLRSWVFPAERARLHDLWDPIGLRGTASDTYSVEDLFVPEAFSSTREDPAVRREPGPLYAFPQQTLYSVGIAGVALGIARGMLDAFVDLACRKAPRGSPRLADSGVIQAEVARCEAKLGAARCYLLDTLAEIYDRADDIDPIPVTDRARTRLAAVHLIHTAVEVADYTYKAAGTDAIFPSGPFARPFRDIHTVSQQIQSREAHFESCGQVLLGSPPAVFL